MRRAILEAAAKLFATMDHTPEGVQLMQSDEGLLQVEFVNGLTRPNTTMPEAVYLRIFGERWRYAGKRWKRVD
jgi:hypothetical protein